MSNTIQNYLATATEKAATDLVAALLKLPEDKRNWSPGGDARTALDLVAECALTTGYTASVIEAQKWITEIWENFPEIKAQLVNTDWDSLHKLLQENTARCMAAIRAMPESAMPVEIVMPWFTQPLSDVIAYPYWNISYHLGQINYIASILGCLE